MRKSGDVGEELRRAGMRTTSARKSVMEALAKEQRPLSHTEIAGLVGEATLDRVTLYRTLDALLDAKLVHRVQGLDGISRYRLHSPGDESCPGGHAHFLCGRCGRMSCLADQRMPRVRVPRGTLVEGKQLVVYGVCRSCRAEGGQ